MDPELELANRVAALLDQSLTEAGVHHFLLGAAALLDSPPHEMLGPGIRFRWYVDERVIEVGAAANPSTGGCSVTVSSFDRAPVIDSREHGAFKLWTPGSGLPYQWLLVLDGRARDWLPYTPVITTWNDLDDTVGDLLNTLPTDIALTPPTWRRPLAYRWTMGPQAPWAQVAFTGEPEGVRVTTTSHAGDKSDLLVPRTLLERGEVSMTDVIAGMAGGAAVSEMDLIGTEGILTRPSRGDGAPGDPPAGSPVSTPRTGMSLEELRQRIATGSSSDGAVDGTDDGPAGPARPGPVVPFQPGMTILEVLDMVEQILAGSPADEVLTAAGARPAPVLDGPGYRAQGWYARPHSDGLEVAVSPEPAAGTCISVRDRANYAWYLAKTIEHRYGAPFGLRASSTGAFWRLFQVGGQGIEVSSGTGTVTVGVSSFEHFLARNYA
ncbi:hypothetical protein [uncultured Actinomyces sp.]|uniref:hypothetical protein n=1 Tax=uncultured Actinomyces sp. TaxID=249061 RepID=UPI0028DC2C15|nr:hypothetical protein [uncultured Actinomyces sp.]